jgi:hypothetical protein
MRMPPFLMKNIELDQELVAFDPAQYHKGCITMFFLNSGLILLMASNLIREEFP